MNSHFIRQLCVILRFARLRMHNNELAFSVNIMLWNKFFPILMEDKRDRWNDIINYDCIIGGADMSVSYV
jgi:hypothetical protein